MMAKEDKYIRTGFFENFRGEDSILIEADVDGLRELEELFGRLAGGLSEASLCGLKYVDSRHCAEITAVCGYEDEGMILRGGVRYEWKLTREKWREFQMKATELLLSGSGHSYLDSDSAANKDLQVVLSLNEPDDFFNDKQ